MIIKAKRKGEQHPVIYNFFKKNFLTYNVKRKSGCLRLYVKDTTAISLIMCGIFDFLFENRILCLCGYVVWWSYPISLFKTLYFHFDIVYVTVAFMKNAHIKIISLNFSLIISLLTNFSRQCMFLIGILRICICACRYVCIQK